MLWVQAMAEAALESGVPDGVIYDFGMNNGDDVEYYLLKGLKVVGVEANPALCRQVEQRFAAEISEGGLTVLNLALSANEAGTTDFFIHKENAALSQLPFPDSMDEFERIRVPCRNPVDVIREHGEPRYVKIDLEGLDVEILRAIFAAGIRPPEISAESHTVDVFACLVEAGYKSFNLVDGESVPVAYREATIETPAGPRAFRFKPHSAGPFGADIHSDWQDPEAFFYALATEGLGWKDIHASRLIAAGPPPRLRMVLRREAAALTVKFARAVGSLAFTLVRGRSKPL